MGWFVASGAIAVSVTSALIGLEWQAAISGFFAGALLRDAMGHRWERKHDKETGQ